MTTEESAITPEARAMIGMESEPITSYPVMEHEIRKYCYAIDDLNPLYLDEDAAKKGPYGGVIAPPFFYNIPFEKEAPLSEHRLDGIPGRSRGGVPMPPLKVERRMAGGTEVEFVRPVRPGDVLTYKTKLAEIYERQGRTGRLVFTVNETTYTNQKGEVVVIERNTGIAR